MGPTHWDWQGTGLEMHVDLYELPLLSAALSPLPSKLLGEGEGGDGTPSVG